MAIHKLPEYMINRLKAWEVVERPSSVIKELVENSLDAWATVIRITINDWWKSLISVEDNGVGIELSDMDLLLERYATSKINGEQDLYNLQSYGFRGEALASISEVSKTSIISKTAYAEIWTKLTKLGQEIVMKHVPVGFKHGTVVSIQDLFYNVPARLKFLKSSQTEYFYCYNYFVDVALYHHDKHFVLLKNDKVVFDVPPANWMMDRITQLWKKDRSKQLNIVEYKDEDISLTGVVSAPWLVFGSADMIKIYVNSRPIADKIIRKALLDAYIRQITPGEYPCAVLLLDIKPALVDVNVHPKKLEVKFMDSNRIFQVIQESVKKTLGTNKISNFSWYETSHSNQNQNDFASNTWVQEWFSFGSSSWSQNWFQLWSDSTIFSTYGFPNTNAHKDEHIILGQYTLIGQIWDSYIVLSTDDSLFYIDQHALAERIAFEKMKKSAWYVKSELLLQPLSVEIHWRADIQEKIDQINVLWFDCSLISENKIIVYAVPQIFSIYKVDIEQLFTHVFELQHITFDHVLDKIFASKACKISIKAWDPLSHDQMIHLVKEWLDSIEWMFVCQHGRPFFVKIEKRTIDKFFDR